MGGVFNNNDYTAGDVNEVVVNGLHAVKPLVTVFPSKHLFLKCVHISYAVYV